MYTYGIIAIFLLLLSGIIFGKRIKQNQLLVIAIVVAGTLIGTSIVNGIIGLNVPLEKTLVKTENYSKEVSHVILRDHDTLTMVCTYLDYERMQKISKKSGDTISVVNYLDIGINDILSPSEDQNLINRTTINFIPQDDTVSVPRLEIYRMKRNVKDNPWVTSFGIPNGIRYFEVYIPDDSIHHKLMDVLQENFFKDEEQYQRIAQLN